MNVAKLIGRPDREQGKTQTVGQGSVLFLYLTTKMFIKVICCKITG